MKQASELIAVLQEANQVVNPKLYEMADMSKSAFGGRGRNRWNRPSYGNDRGSRGGDRDRSRSGRSWEPSRDRSRDTGGRTGGSRWGAKPSTTPSGRSTGFQSSQPAKGSLLGQGPQAPPPLMGSTPSGGMGNRNFNQNTNNSYGAPARNFNQNGNNDANRNSFTSPPPLFVGGNQDNKGSIPSLMGDKGGSMPSFMGNKNIPPPSLLGAPGNKFYEPPNYSNPPQNKFSQPPNSSPNKFSQPPNANQSKFSQLPPNAGQSKFSQPPNGMAGGFGNKGSYQNVGNNAYGQYQQQQPPPPPPPQQLLNGYGGFNQPSGKR